MSISTMFEHDAANLIWQMQQDFILTLERPSEELRRLVKAADETYGWNLDREEVTGIALLLGKHLWNMRRQAQVP